MKSVPLVLLTGAAAFALAVSISTVDFGTVPWAISRASGLAAFVSLSLAMVFGLLITTRVSDGIVSKPLTFEMHQFFSVLSLALLVVHTSSLLFDRYVSFGVTDILVPFTSSYAPLSVGVGVVAAWMAAMVTASFWFKRRLGHRTWRLLHFGTFASYLLALWHGLGAGSDTATMPVFLVYVFSLAAVLGLTFYRAAAVSTGRAGRRKPAVDRRALPAAAPNLRDLSPSNPQS